MRKDADVVNLTVDTNNWNKAALSANDINEIANLVEQILLRMGLNPNEESGLAATPARVAKYLAEFNQGAADYHEILRTFDKAGDYHPMVVQAKIPFRMMCEHHLAPAHGTAAFAYVPSKIVVGLSKIARLVDVVAVQRPSLQEIIGDQIVDMFNEVIEPKGSAVVIRAAHSCMTCRGVKAPGTVTTTSSVRGVFRDVPSARAEFLTLIQHDLTD